jgi:hypothetical protein
MTRPKEISIPNPKRRLPGVSIYNASLTSSAGPECAAPYGAWAKRESGSINIPPRWGWEGGRQSRLIKANQGWAEVNYQIIKPKIIRLGAVSCRSACLAFCPNGLLLAAAESRVRDSALRGGAIKAHQGWSRLAGTELSNCQIEDCQIGRTCRDGRALPDFAAACFSAAASRDVSRSGGGGWLVWSGRRFPGRSRLIKVNQGWRARDFKCQI